VYHDRVGKEEHANTVQCAHHNCSGWNMYSQCAPFFKINLPFRPPDDASLAGRQSRQNAEKQASKPGRGRPKTIVDVLLCTVVALAGALTALLQRLLVLCCRAGWCSAVALAGTKGHNEKGRETQIRIRLMSAEPLRCY
jgi:hypothetical protein